jgi:hypothetical protein
MLNPRFLWKVSAVGVLLFVLLWLILGFEQQRQISTPVAINKTSRTSDVVASTSVDANKVISSASESKLGMNSENTHSNEKSSTNGTLARSLMEFRVDKTAEFEFTDLFQKYGMKRAREIFAEKATKGDWRYGRELARHSRMPWSYGGNNLSQFLSALEDAANEKKSLQEFSIYWYERAARDGDVVSKYEYASTIMRLDQAKSLFDGVAQLNSHRAGIAQDFQAIAKKFSYELAREQIIDGFDLIEQGWRYGTMGFDQNPVYAHACSLRLAQLHPVPERARIVRESAAQLRAGDIAAAIALSERYPYCDFDKAN